MNKSKLDVVGIGNAIVDVLLQVDDSFLSEHKMVKGSMALIDADQFRVFYKKLGKGLKASGGSAANTTVGISQLGGRAAFIGKINKDKLGRAFCDSMSSAGVKCFTGEPCTDIPTACCLVLVTKDAERTMNTFLGASVKLGEQDISEDLIASAKVTYLEGYLWDSPEARKAYQKACAYAAKHSRTISLSLSDKFCVDRHRDDLRRFIEGNVNILFGNEDEIISLYQANSFDDAVREACKSCKVLALTRGAEGSLVVNGDSIYEIKAKTESDVLDTTGAGDSYASGFLYGITHGFDFPRSARLGSMVASKVISQYGARLGDNIVELVEESNRK